MSLSYKYKKMLVSIKQGYAKKEYTKAIGKLALEQLKVFTLVSDLAVKNRSCIRFDIETEETLILLPDILITATKYKIVIQNTHGFLTTQFPLEAYDILYKTLSKEGHRERRKLKHDVKTRINDFLTKMNVIDNNDIELIKD